MVESGAPVGEFRNPTARIALFRTLAILLAVTVSTINWVVFRLPSSGLTSAMAPLLLTCGVLSSPSPELRRRNFFLYIFAVAAIQFGRGWLSYHDGLSLAFVALATFLVHRFISNSAGAASVMAAGLQDVGQIGFAENANAVISLILAGLIIAWLYSLLEKFFPIPRDRPIMPQAPPFDNAAIFRRTLMFTIAYYFVELTGWQESFWITLSVGIACSGGETGERLHHVAFLRGLLAPAGFVFAIFWMESSAWMNYQFNYLLFAIGFAAFYILHRYGNYAVFYILFLLMITAADTLTAGQFKFGNPYNYLFQGMACVGIGNAIILLVEPRTREKSELAANPA